MENIKTKISVIIVSLMILAGCAAPPKPSEKRPPMPPGFVKPQPLEISGITVEPKIFDPRKEEAVTISFRLSRPGKASVEIFDPTMHLICEMFGEEIGSSGLHQVVWSGRDLEGRLVPDEAYFFTIEARGYQRNTAVYDPTTLSGGTYLAPRIAFDAQHGTVSYHLDRDARVRIRAGISGGPLLKTIVNWAPRLAGDREENWDGRDESGHIDVVDQRDYRLIAEAVSLPEHSIFTVGNTEYCFLTYRRDIAPDRPKKKERPLFQDPKSGMGQRFTGPILYGPEPAFSMSLAQCIEKNETGLPVVKGKVPVKISLDKGIKRYVTEQRYEIIFFVDFAFSTEIEEGYSPSSLLWDSTKVPNGVHILTANVATFTGQVASASLTVFVKN
jgi:hypothetical protein